MLPFVYRAMLNADLPPGEVPLPSSPAMASSGSSALDEAMAKTLAAIDPTLANAIPIPEESKYTDCTLSSGICLLHTDYKLQCILTRMRFTICFEKDCHRICYSIMPQLLN